MTSHQFRFPIIPVIICVIPFIVIYEGYVHTPMLDECIKSHMNDGQTEMTKHKICDEYQKVPNPYYRSTYP